MKPDDNTASLNNTEKDPDDWKTGQEPITGAQKSYLETLSQANDEDIPDSMTKAEASKKIDELKKNQDQDQSR